MSALGRHIRKLADREGAGERNFLTPAFNFSVPADDLTAEYVLPVDAMLVAGSMSVSAAGSVSEGIVIGIDNATQSVTDLDGDELDLAQGAGTYASASILSDMTALEGNQGDVYLITIDDIDGGGTAVDLNINLTFVTL